MRSKYSIRRAVKIDQSESIKRKNIWRYVRHCVIKSIRKFCIEQVMFQFHVSQLCNISIYRHSKALHRQNMSQKSSIDTRKLCIEQIIFQFSSLAIARVTYLSTFKNSASTNHVSKFCIKHQANNSIYTFIALFSIFLYMWRIEIYEFKKITRLQNFKKQTHTRRARLEEL